MERPEPEKTLCIEFKTFWPPHPISRLSRGSRGSIQKPAWLNKVPCAKSQMKNGWSAPKRAYKPDTIQGLPGGRKHPGLERCSCWPQRLPRSKQSACPNSGDRVRATRQTSPRTSTGRSAISVTRERPSFSAGRSILLPLGYHGQCPKVGEEKIVT